MFLRKARGVSSDSKLLEFLENPPIGVRSFGRGIFLARLGPKTTPKSS